MEKRQLPQKRLKIGVSACLLGEPVRYDGGHKRSETLVSVLAVHYELLPICPEVAAGLGVPRPPVQLLVKEGEIRALGVENGQLDVTDPLNAFSRQWAHQQAARLCGFVLKSRSPSCGLGTTPICDENGGLQSGNGLFVQQLIQVLPHLPVIDEEALENPSLRQRFVQRVESYVAE